MGSTKLRKTEVNESKLNDKQHKFVMEYCIDFNAQRAAISAGYAEGSAGVTGARLLTIPHVAKAIGKIRNDDLVHLQLTREEVLKQLYYCCTRSAEDFCDDQGKIITDVRKLTKRACNAIDGLKQTVKSWTDENGEVHEEVITELKLVPKAAAIDMAMKHKGLFAPTKSEVTVGVFNWDMLASGPNQDSIIEAEVRKMESQ